MTAPSEKISKVRLNDGDLRAIAASTPNEIVHGMAEELLSLRAEHEEMRDESSYKVQLASALLTIEQIRQIACGEIEPIDDDTADVATRKINRMCIAHLAAQGAARGKG